MNTEDGKPPEVISIEFIPSVNGAYQINIEQGFQATLNETGTVLDINGHLITITGYHSLLPPIKKRIQKSLILKPIPQGT